VQEYMANIFTGGKRLALSPYKQCELLFRTDDGNPWRLDKMPFFVRIYDKPADKILLITSRQTGKTTYIRNESSRKSMFHQGNSILYAAPTDSQVTDFSTKKLDKIFEYNQHLSKMFRGQIWNVHQKQFTTGSTITLRSTGGAQGAGRIRGNTANDIFLDELQDLEPEEIPVIEECAATFDGVDGRKLASYIYTGTPLSSQNHITIRYNASRKLQWHMQCPHCSQYAGTDRLGRDLYKGGWQDELTMAHIDLHKPFLFCQHCGRDMNSPRGLPQRMDGRDDLRVRKPPHGLWISHNPRGNFDGYRIVRLMMPWAHWRTTKDDGVLDKLTQYTDKRFANEVMGMPYDAGSMPITEPDIRRCTCTEQGMEEYDLPVTEADIARVAERHQQHYKFAGLDWAMQATNDETASYTIFGVFALVNGQLKLIFAHKFVGAGANDPDHVLKRVRGWMHQFDIKRLGADYGVGYKEDLRLLEEFGIRRVAIFQYKGSMAKSNSTYDRSSLKWIVPKTRTLDQLCNDIHQVKFVLPRYENVRTFTDDWLRLSIEEKPDGRYHSYTRIGPDDFVHVANYANMAKRLEFREDEFNPAMARYLPDEVGAMEPDLARHMRAVGQHEGLGSEPLDTFGLHY
jgi:hypothetical protein